MADVFNVKAAYDKPSYNKGDKMTISISGNDVLTASSEGLGGKATLTLTAADGATTTITLDPVKVVTTTSTPQSVVISKLVDDSGRAWAIDASGLTATATA